MEPKYYRNWHLARSEAEYTVTELEWSIIRFLGAFTRWVTTVGSIVVESDIKFTEHLILHVIRMQDKPKTSATISRMINRDDVPNIQYSLRKLEGIKLIEKVPDSGKVPAYQITALGREVTDEYAKIRSSVLLGNLASIANVQERIGDATALLSVLTGIYDESARSSANFSHGE